MTRSVYLVRASAFLPNAPVDNERMEALLGQVGAKPSRARALVLRSNGIESRHYAIDPATGCTTHSNAQLTAEAVRALADGEFDIGQMDLLACGTSSPDQLMPNHAVMVHGELATPRCETMAAAGICVAGVTAMKYAFMSVACGQSSAAVATGSEVASSFMRSRNFTAERDSQIDALARRPALAFEKDFLRWMLSDGAGAVLLRDRPRANGLSLKVEWIDSYSYAGDLETCMYAGATKDAVGRLRGWREFDSIRAVADEEVLAVKQDVRLLENGIREASSRGFAELIARRGLPEQDVDWFLPHYSSKHFRPVLWDVLPPSLRIAQDRWFTNLARVGNVGSASIYLMIEELMRSGSLREGQRVLCFVPESGRFSVAFIYLTAVAS